MKSIFGTKKNCWYNYWDKIEIFLRWFDCEKLSAVWYLQSVKFNIEYVCFYYFLVKQKRTKNNQEFKKTILWRTILDFLD